MDPPNHTKPKGNDMSSFKFRPSLESLDARLTPSVTVVQVANELIITGDKEADVVRLRDNGQG